MTADSARLRYETTLQAVGLECSFAQVTSGSTGTGRDRAGSPVHGTGVPIMFPSGRRDQFTGIGEVIAFAQGLAIAQLTSAESPATEIENAIRCHRHAERAGGTGRRQSSGSYDGSCWAAGRRSTISLAGT